MFDGTQRRIVSMWFPRLASDRARRRQPVDGPFALIQRQGSADRIYCLTTEAEDHGLHRGMAATDARAFCRSLLTRPADPEADYRALHLLRRWATRYCPWVGIEGADGLVLDITGAAHLAGGEAAMLADMRQRLTGAGYALRLGLADTRGAAWALAHHGPVDGVPPIAPPGDALAALGRLPVAALRLEDRMTATLERLGLRSIGDLAGAARAPLNRRFGPDLLLRLDQALGQQPEQISPLVDPPHYATRMTLPEPIGLTSDVMAVLQRLLDRLCETMKRHETGARMLHLTLRRVDRDSQQIALRLAAPLRDPVRILPLFQRSVDEVDAGFGIDQMRLEAVQTDALPARQLGGETVADAARLDDLMTRIGTRIGLENIRRFLPADSHIPERGFISVAAAHSTASPKWSCHGQRPLHIFPPEPVTASGSEPPQRFRWRRMSLSLARATGPERIAPEWWAEHQDWHRGLRDYWRIETMQGRRLWMFHTPQNPGWFVHGEFP
ncbi:DNA polymerase Y family protein [Paracoccus aurantiacus]|uniref:DNA-directed DNA polymerase n=1 Tax=Paracoccus aurantiacus TaxID=2599412 RepID=A0A5C6SAT7_9RHOB|nr:DNA polymerase Y family protein [Paracoccus aurantiacus]TXB71142.1 DNA polymerase Y family protein [Paracoccus aurantiacus]